MNEEDATFPVFQYVHQSNLIENIDNTRADADSVAAWFWLAQRNVLTPTTICQLQSKIVAHQSDLKPAWRGRFRQIPVYIGGREAMTQIAIPGAIDDWIKSLDKIGPKAAHVAFEKIHPFVDGNGRTGRMLMWWQEIKHGYGDPTIIKFSERQDYYGWFR